jgi:hypothetical protein
VLELAEILREAGPAYRERYGSRLLPSHRRALRDIEACRTPALGGHLWACDACDERRYSYHSCRNRHCPKCHTDQTRRWLKRQSSRLLPCPYFLVTFTLPAELRRLARSNQRLLYGLLMWAAAESLLKLTADKRYLGGRPGLLAVLHTWTRALVYHPHVHILVTAGGWRGGASPGWVASRRAGFLVPGRALSVVFRAKIRDGLRRAGLLDQTPAEVWKKNWVVHLKHAGSGEAVLDYLGRYVYRVAIVNSRLERFEDGRVTFRYRDNRTGQTRRCTLEASAFIARFLQHVLPDGFTKVRSYGLFSPSHKALLEKARDLLRAASAPEASSVASSEQEPPSTSFTACDRDTTIPCPSCGIGRMRIIETLARWRPPP